MNNIFVIAILIMISGLLFYALVMLFRSNKGKRIGIGTIILALILITFLKSFLIGDYPDSKSTLMNENEIIRQYNPDVSYTIETIKKWVIVDGIGLVYISEIKAVNESHIRMFYRTIGMSADELFEAEVKFINHEGLAYDFDGAGAGAHIALILSSGSLDFFSEMDPIDKISQIIINGTEIDL